MIINYICHPYGAKNNINDCFTIMTSLWDFTIIVYTGKMRGRNVFLLTLMSYGQKNELLPGTYGQKKELLLGTYGQKNELLL